MKLSGYQHMDPVLLLGLINTELRNHCESLDDLVKTHNIDQDALEKLLGEAGFEYLAETNQFR